MLKIGTRSWIALGCALGVALLAYGLVLRSPGEGASQATIGPHEDDANRLAKFAVPSPLRSASLEPDDDEGEARGDGLRSGDSEIQHEDEAWDELSDVERRAQLEEIFSGAVDELEAGGGSSLLVAQAEGALSELRAQMYSTVSGRKEHEALEERLSKVSEERKDDDVDDEK